jgi:cell wall-associated NlpC family hydrolase
MVELQGAAVFHMSLPPARIVRVALAALPLVLTGCGVSAVRTAEAEAHAARVPSTSAADRSPGDRAAAIAANQVGVPYRYGGRSTEGFDCSGLVSYAYGRAGRMVPRTTGALWRQLRPVALGELRPGDVLFFDIAGKPSHVGLYLGEGRFVHAPSTGREVSIEELETPYYRRAFIRGGRPR